MKMINHQAILSWWYFHMSCQSLWCCCTFLTANDRL